MNIAKDRKHLDLEYFEEDIKTESKQYNSNSKQYN